MRAKIDNAKHPKEHAGRGQDGTQYVVTCDWDWQHNACLRSLDELPTWTDKHAKAHPGRVILVHVWQFARRAQAVPRPAPEVRYIA